MLARSKTQLYVSLRIIISAAAASAVAMASAAATTAAAPPARPPPPPPNAVRLLLTGDVMLGRGVDQILPRSVSPRLYEGYVKDARDYVDLAIEANGPLPPRPQRGSAYPWGFALGDAQAMSPDARVVNLETALTAGGAPWPDKGIHYRSHPYNAATLAAARVDVASCANNHAADWGRAALLETLAALKSAGIQPVGAGRDAAEAWAPAVVAFGGGGDGGNTSGSSNAHRPAGRVLVFAAGHASSGVFADWAAEGGEGGGKGGESGGGPRPGVAVTGFTARDVERFAARVRAARRPGDVAVASLHAGSNWGFDVPVEQARFARALIDEAGVDVVHCHSSHHVRGFEAHSGKLVLYGCGDLISDYEGIRNTEVEAAYPRISHRDDVGALWYADVRVADGALLGLTLTPTRLRHLRLERPDAADVAYLKAALARGAAGIPGGGGNGSVREVDGGRLAAVLPPPPPPLMRGREEGERGGQRASLAQAPAGA